MSAASAAARLAPNFANKLEKSGVFPCRLAIFICGFSFLLTFLYSSYLEIVLKFPKQRSEVRSFCRGLIGPFKPVGLQGNNFPASLYTPIVKTLSNLLKVVSLSVLPKPFV